MNNFIKNGTDVTRKELVEYANNFIDYLIENEYLDKYDAADDLHDHEIIEDFVAAYEVAPRLINILRDISDR